MAIKDTISKDDLLKATFWQIVELYQVYQGRHPELKTEIGDTGLTVEVIIKALWNCTDPIPQKLFKIIKKFNSVYNKQTYAAAARSLCDSITYGLYLGEDS